MDRAEIVFERRRLHAGIDRGEAPADIDDIDGNRGIDDRRAHPLERLNISERRHRLAADMEADAKPVGYLASGLQQRRGIGEIDPEFGCEAELSIFGRHPQPNAQAQVAGRRAVVLRGRRDDLVELFLAVEAERAHTVPVIGFGDGRGRLHRMHEAQGRFGQNLADQAHFGDRGDVVVRYPRIPKYPQQCRRGIGLHRIERRPWKLLDEETGGARGGVRAVQDNGFVGRKGADYSRCIGMDVQFKGPPIGLAAR